MKDAYLCIAIDVQDFVSPCPASGVRNGLEAWPYRLHRLYSRVCRSDLVVFDAAGANGPSGVGAHVCVGAPPRGAAPQPATCPLSHTPPCHTARSAMPAEGGRTRGVGARTGDGGLSGASVSRLLLESLHYNSIIDKDTMHIKH